jgi:transmembrane sensor
MPREDIKFLLEQYMQGRLTDAQASALLDYTSPGQEAELLLALREYLEEESSGAPPADPEALQVLLQKVLSVDKAPRVRPLFRRKWMGWAAAVLVLALGGWYVGHTRRAAPPLLATQTQAERFRNDVSPPAGSKAVLTLAGGKQVILDSVSDGTLGQQGNANVVKVDSGNLTYRKTEAEPAGIVYNMLSTGRGGQTAIVLSDGTKVWLDASSSLRFPVAFQGKERRVEVTGQAYFEVASAELDPGQQASVDAMGNVIRLDHADVEEAVAWRNGYFVFHGLDMASLLREAARWYDVDIENRRAVNPKFYGEVPRNTPLSDLLKAMEFSGQVKFGIAGKKIIVL